jgi:hypothetical protein
MSGEAAMIWALSRAHHNGGSDTLIIATHLTFITIILTFHRWPG